MKVLFTSFAHNTHFFPMVPLAWAFRSAGHEVRVASQPDLASAITGAGLTAVPAGTPLSAGVPGPPEWVTDDPGAPDVLGQILQDGSDFVESFDYTGRDPAQWSWEGLLALENIMVPSLYATMNSDSMVSDLAGFAQHWQPDLVIWEMYTFAGAVAARVCGAAHARLVWGPDVALRARRAFLRHAASLPPEHREDPTGEWLGWLLARYGCRFDEELVTGQWTIDPNPASTRLDLGVHTVGVRYVPYNGPSVLPGWLREPARGPRVVLSFGLSGTAEGMGDSLASVVRAVASLDVEVIVTAGTARLAEMPRNVRVVDFVPLHDLLPSCSVIVHHGGIGTTATAEWHGVPQIILTGGYDTVVKAENIASLGAGFAIPMAQLDASEIRQKVARVLREPSVRQAAGRLRGEILAAPAPNDIVGVLEELAAQNRLNAAPPK